MNGCAERLFLVVIDESEEMRVALHYAARRAAHTGGRVALVTVIEPPDQDVQHWMAVEDLVREELRQNAEQALQHYAEEVVAICGTLPVLYIREGERRDAVLRLLAEEPSISVLVLAVGTGPNGPGPLISYLCGKGVGRWHVPVTLVPGNLSDAQLDAIT
ncbi:MAG: universal stress protein [Azospirillaceae bacterium]|nr:universal stress protein [Azospirillaceae bacterium]